MDASIARARSKHFLERSQATLQFPNAQLQDRMNGLRSDSGERIQHEGSFVHPWVRHSQARLSDDAVPIQQEIYVQGPRRVADESLAIAGALDRENRIQQVPRLEGSLDSDTRIAEDPASGAIHGLSLNQRGARQDDTASGKCANRVANVLAARAEVRAEPEVRPSHDWCVRSRLRPTGLRTALGRRAFGPEP